MADSPLTSLIAAAAKTATEQPKTSPFTAPIVNQSAEYVHRAAWKAGVLGSINVLALVLAARFVLLVAVVGAIVLSMIAVRDPDPWRLGVLGIYAVVVVVPTIWLASRR